MTTFAQHREAPPLYVWTPEMEAEFRQRGMHPLAPDGYVWQHNETTTSIMLEAVLVCPQPHGKKPRDPVSCSISPNGCGAIIISPETPDRLVLSLLDVTIAWATV